MSGLFAALQKIGDRAGNGWYFSGMRLSRRHMLWAGTALAASGPAWAGRSEIGYPRVLQGPMAGLRQGDGQPIWVRVSGRFPVQIQAEGEDGRALVSDIQTAGPEADFIVTLMLRGVRPGETIRYRVAVDGEPDRYLRDLPPFRLRTAPDAPADIRIAFGSCARVQASPVQPIWDVLRDLEPDLFCWLGDNVYVDSVEPQFFAESYRAQRAVPNARRFMAEVPQLAIWDDHDYGLDDHDRTNPVKAQALEIFRRYWINPSHGTLGTPGVFFRTSLGGVDLFFLDVRYHRSPNVDPDGPGKTMLGQAQLAWLKSWLSASPAPLKLIFSGSGWSMAKGPGGDSWAAFLHERDALFGFIRDQGIGGVVLVSGDTHVGELNCIPWSARGGYDLYDLTSSPLAQRPVMTWLRRRPELRMREAYPRSPNAGVIDIVQSAGVPRLTYRLFDTEGRSVWEPFTVTADELQNGVESWRGKIDPREAERHESFMADDGYYRRTYGPDFDPRAILRGE